jgi:hypothetical protein
MNHQQHTTCQINDFSMNAVAIWNYTLNATAVVVEAAVVSLLLLYMTATSHHCNR